MTDLDQMQRNIEYVYAVASQYNYDNGDEHFTQDEKWDLAVKLLSCDSVTSRPDLPSVMEAGVYFANAGEGQAGQPDAATEMVMEALSRAEGQDFFKLAAGFPHLACVVGLARNNSGIHHMIQNSGEAFLTRYQAAVREKQEMAEKEAERQKREANDIFDSMA